MQSHKPLSGCFRHCLIWHECPQVGSLSVIEGLPQFANLPSAFTLSATSVGTPAGFPLLTPAFFTHSGSVWAEQPTFSEIETPAAHREG